jgi:HEAT repeat protein/MFS-type transporter involved in bile tolerance (Atg22 family)
MRGLKISTWEAVWATVWMVLTTGAFQTGFALGLGATPLALGLLAALPAAAGLLQLPASLYVEKRGERRKFIATAAILGRLCWLVILLIPFLLPTSVRLLAFLIATSLSAALLTITVPAWTSWMSDLVPESSRGQYFAGRNMLAGIVAMLVPLPAGAFLDQATKYHKFDPSIGFAVLFGLASIAAVVSCVLILRQPEPKMVKRGEAVNPWKTLSDPLRDTQFRPFLAFSALTVLGQALAGQFFMAWSVDAKALGQEYLTVQVLGAVASGASLATMPLWGYLADKFSPRPILGMASVGVIIAPIIWLFTAPELGWGNIPLIIIINIFSGASWAGFGLAQFNLLLSLAPTEKRSTYTAVFSAVTGIIGGVAPLLGGVLMESLATLHMPLGPIVLNNYKALFILTAIIRILAVFLLARLHDPAGNAKSVRYVLSQVTRSQPVQSYKNLRRLSRPAQETERIEAAAALGELRSPLAVEELATALGDVSFDVRASAARALGDIGDSRAVFALCAKLNDPAAAIGEIAAESLGQIGDRHATPALIEAMQGPDASVRIAAIRALGKIADRTAAPALIQNLTTNHPTRCEAACVALGAIGAELSPAESSTAFARLLYLLAPEVERGMRMASAKTLRTFLSALPDPSEAYAQLRDRMQTETEAAVLAQEAGALSSLGNLLKLDDNQEEDHHPIPDLLPLLNRPNITGLAHLQILEAIADAALTPGTLYPYLGMKEMPRDEAMRRLLANQYPEALTAYAEGDLRGALRILVLNAPRWTEFFLTRTNPTPEEVLLVALLV